MKMIICPTCHEEVEDIGFCTACGEVFAGHCECDGSRSETATCGEMTMVTAKLRHADK